MDELILNLGKCVRPITVKGSCLVIHLEEAPWTEGGMTALYAQPAHCNKEVVEALAQLLVDSCCKYSRRIKQLGSNSSPEQRHANTRITCQVTESYLPSSHTARLVLLTWWNVYVRSVTLDTAHTTPWSDFKAMFIRKYCPRNEIKQMENELWNLKVKGTNLTAYNRRVTLTSSKPVDLHEAIEHGSRFDLPSGQSARREKTRVTSTENVDDTTLTHALLLVTTVEGPGHLGLKTCRALLIPHNQKRVPEAMDGQGSDVNLISDVANERKYKEKGTLQNQVLSKQWDSRRIILVLKEDVEHLAEYNSHVTEMLAVKGLQRGEWKFCRHRQVRGKHKNISKRRIEDVPVVRDFPEVFPEDLPGLPTTSHRKANVVADALSQKERIKPLRVRALVMTIGLDLPSRILEARKEAVKVKNVEAEDIEGMLKKLEARVDGTLCLDNRSWLPCYGDTRILIMHQDMAYRCQSSPIVISISLRGEGLDNLCIKHWGKHVGLEYCIHYSDGGQIAVSGPFKTFEDMLRNLLVIVLAATFEARLLVGSVFSPVCWVEVGWRKHNLSGKRLSHCGTTENIFKIRDRMQAARDR
ncbi:putative reverse transcriptase domain-containing protein [Tanacetum coccineum]|uniref:Reverse transcriptase domain-containing protein n=1 Tax=Tanacetum coccineum TaxID=301880 RepID=A0ABQ5FE72_9ASTR